MQLCSGSMSLIQLKENIKQTALNSGYDLVAISAPNIPPEDQDNLNEFLKNKNHADMAWLESTKDLRFEPGLVFAGVKSILVLASYYRDYQAEEYLQENSDSKKNTKVSRFAHGKDYHKVLRKKGKNLLREIKLFCPEAKGRIVTDSAPVMEKVLARQAGLGWMGKHTNIIHPRIGSWFFISALLLNLDLRPDQPMEDLCRDCRLCIDACPTSALDEYQIDARKCLSYITIEAKKKQDQNSFPADREGWVFGCDICQEVCPYNRNKKTRSKSTTEIAFQIRPEIESFLKNGGQQYSKQDLNPDTWNDLLQGSPLKRAGIQHLRENIINANKR